MAARKIMVTCPHCGREDITRQGQKNGKQIYFCKNPDCPKKYFAESYTHIVYADGNYAYQTHITESDVVTGKRNTQRIERKHLSLRTWCSRLVRKGIRFSKTHQMHSIVVGLVINIWFFGRAFTEFAV